MLGVDEVLVGQKLQYYIGLIALIRLIGLIGLIGLMADKANSAQRLIVFYWANRFYLANKVIRADTLQYIFFRFVIPLYAVD